MEPLSKNGHKTRLKDIKVVFFDLDDTLCGYWEACKLGLRQTFEKHPLPGYSTEDLVKHWAAAFREFSPTLKKSGWYDGYLKQGEPTRTEQMRLTLERVGLEDREMAKQLSMSYADYRNMNLRLFSETLAVIERLKREYPLGLITNGPADIQRQEIETLGLQKHFTYVFIEGEMGRGKPLPEVFEHAAEQVAAKPHEILFVGNSYAHDVAPALKAGWRAVWVRRASDVPPSAGEESKPEEMPEGAQEPDAIIGDLRELYGLLGLEEPATAGSIRIEKSA